MPGKRSWRKLVKKYQRQRRRQRCAQERDHEQMQRELDPAYQIWMQQQAELEEFQRLAAERQQQDMEEAWLRREALAQRQFRVDLAKRRQEEAELERLREQQFQELAAREKVQRERREERQRMVQEAAAEFEAMMQRMHDFLENAEQRSPPPDLQRVAETRPEEKPCEFFTRTNSCRFGLHCTFNHKRPMLARILLIRHFFTHPLLHSDVHKEYATADADLELNERDLRNDYDEFFADVVPELEKFGRILNFRAVRNTLAHLRGHVFVEYEQERSALRAFINLQGRYYASRRLNVEFSNLKTWRGAVCGM
ncbi:U2 small nuclear ribonucleoprotein auxiliary factor 35 kDa subunit-related protein 2 isoform X2 [Scaptodrosophila lebanonensis]|uniref:U2 small nuclear ribonucleoprotein auxiliary factor 35 kDa subunit-related protein 2 isoform X2 n=1 Tax=Drosophila lebanonensis TaxID=7225 RepID=A0A6J2U4T8_DROLE|nr:U2 small nuclear ribonucleoprotein auxiliary factor 35 kDa subunit-related protein 2 isoform X2 [Scaptodrosophila lebanonensis]